MDISEQVNELRHKADTYNTVGSAWELNRAEAKRLQKTLREAADTIESISTKLQAENKERSAENCGGGWIYCDEWLPSTVEYMELEPTPHMKRLEIAYMTDTVEYLIGYYDGSKWMDNHHNIIKNVIAWRKFLPLPEKCHEP